MKSVLRPNSIKIFELLFSAIAIQLFVVYFLISEAISETEPKILIIPGLILFTTIRVSRYKGEVARGITVLYSLIFAFMFFFLSYQVGIRDFLETDVDDYFSITIPFLFSAVGMYFAFTKESTEWIYDKDNEEGDIPNEENLDSDQLDLEKSSTERPISSVRYELDQIERELERAKELEQEKKNKRKP